MDGTVLKSFAILFASVGVVFLVLMALKKVSKKFTLSNNSVELKVLSKLALNPKSQLYIIEADGKTLLLGVSEKSINTLAELSDEQRISSFDLNKPQRQTKPANAKLKQNSNDNLSFMSFLKSSVGMKQEINQN